MTMIRIHNLTKSVHIPIRFTLAISCSLLPDFDAIKLLFQ